LLVKALRRYKRLSQLGIVFDCNRYANELIKANCNSINYQPKALNKVTHYFNEIADENFILQKNLV
jgi:hypothetical protein